MVFVLLVFVIFSVFACKFIHDKSVKWSKLKIPRREKYPFIVELFYPLVKLAFTSAEQRLQAIKDYNEPFPDLLKCWVGPEMLIYVNGPDLIQKVLMSTECFDKPKLIYSLLGFGSGLITASTKNMWKAHRKFFNFSFSLSILEGFLPTFVDLSDSLAENLLKESNKSEFNFFDYAKKTSFDILYATSLGGNIREFRNQPIYEKVFDAFES
jgi:cytochrome P450